MSCLRRYFLRTANTNAARIQFKIALVAVLVLAAGGRAASAEALRPADLYRATVIVTGTDMRSRPVGFAEAMREVLVRVSGDPKLRLAPLTNELVSHAETFVATFGYVDPMAARRPHDDQGSYDRSYDLSVQFDPVRIDDALRKLGSRPWGGDRPTIIPVLAIRGSDPPWVGSFLLAADSPAGAEQRAAFANASTRYGIQVHLPTTAELAKLGVSADGSLLREPSRDPGVISITGSLEFRPSALGWVGSWRMRWLSSEREFKVGGVSFDEAFDHMVRDAVAIGSGNAPPD